MEKEKKIDGFLYTQSLCSAIDRYTTAKEHNSPTIFMYRGANLRFAVERALYFAFANNNNLFEAYNKWNLGILPINITLPNQLEKEILINMCDINPDRVGIMEPKLFVRFKLAVKEITKNFILILRINHLAKSLRALINIKRCSGRTYQILIAIRSERFTKYLDPISKEITVPFAYITYNKKTIKYLHESNQPCIKVSRMGYFIERWTHSDSIIDQFGISDQYDYLFDILKILKPSSVVIVEGNAPHDEIVNQICKQIESNSICIQQGWSPIVHNGFRHMTYSKMLVWGDGFAEDLVPYNSDQYFISTGSHVIKLSNVKTAKKAGDKIKIGFLPPMPTMILSEYNYNEFMKLIPWVANEFKNVEIVVSEHPTIVNNQRFKEIADYRNIKFLSSKTNSLQEIIGGNDISVSFFSTTILESIAAGSLPIIVNLTTMPHHLPDVDAQGAGIEVKSIGEAKKVIAGLINNPNSIFAYKTDIEKFKEKYFACDRDKAIGNIVKEISS